jgi:putative heme-binding domain-containing protein
LEALAANPQVPIRLRLLSLAALSAERPPNESEFTLLLAQLTGSASPTERATAVSLLSGISLNSAQLTALAGTLPMVGALEFPTLLGLFGTDRSPSVGTALANAIAGAPAAASVSPDELERLLGRFPAESVLAARERLGELRAQLSERMQRLDHLSAQAGVAGDAARGRLLFEAGTGACTSCHLIGPIGTDFGPNLSTIGRIRQPRDLLESILFPDASLARDFEAHLVQTNDGATRIGLIRDETATSLTLVLPGGGTARLPGDQIKSFQRVPVSLMPAGLESAFDEDQLLSLVAYLHSLK